MYFDSLNNVGWENVLDEKREDGQLPDQRNSIRNLW
jgi:hypothetical protein